jgi:dipeptidase E
VRDRIAAADLIYVGGGNTRLMLATWHLRGVDELLVAAARRGTVLGGLSAGAICWFARAHSHADRLPRRPGDGCLPGLGLLPGVCAPHFSQEPWRIGILRALLAREGGVGVGIDDCAAVQVRGDRFRVLACRDGRLAHRYEALDAATRASPRHGALPADGAWRPLEELTGAAATP